MRSADDLSRDCQWALQMYDETGEAKYLSSYELFARTLQMRNEPTPADYSRKLQAVQDIGLLSENIGAKIHGQY